MEDKPIGIIKDTKYSSMYRLIWADGVLSQDMYNHTRAGDILLHYDLYRANMLRPDPTWLNKRLFQSAK